ncbi:MAG: hypothetical protein ACOZB0_05830 [Pseudomonadota bacterium]
MREENVDSTDHDEDHDPEMELRERLDQWRDGLENPPGPDVLFSEVDLPDKLFGASDEEKEQAFRAEAYRAVFDSDPYWRETAMPQHVMRYLAMAGAPKAVQDWMAWVFHEAKIPHHTKGRPVDRHAPSDLRHDLAVFILDNESNMKGRKTAFLEFDATDAMAKKGHHAASYGTIKAIENDKAFKEQLESYRRRREYLKQVCLPKK